MVCDPERGAAQLLGGLTDEDPAVRSELFRRYDGFMRRRANLVLRDAEAADDAVQDAWLTVLTRLRDFSGRSAILTWMLAITQNCARNRRRKERRFVRMSTPEPAHRDPSREELNPDAVLPATAELSPELLFLRREALQHLEAALERLPESLKSVVLLRDVVGASSADACRLLEITDSAQRTRLHRGRLRLRQELSATR